YVAQRSIRSTLQWAGALLDNRVMTTVSGTYSYNQHQPGSVDINLDPVVQFTLRDEGDRPVFVQPGSIVPATGAIASGDGRVSALYNPVTELRSDFTSVTRQLQLQLAPASVNSQYTWGLAYTLNSVRDHVSGFTSTAGNPFDLSPGRSGLDWRHQIQLIAG